MLIPTITVSTYVLNDSAIIYLFYVHKTIVHKLLSFYLQRIVVHMLCGLAVYKQWQQKLAKQPTFEPVSLIMIFLLKSIPIN